MYDTNANSREFVLYYTSKVLLDQTFESILVEQAARRYGAYRKNLITYGYRGNKFSFICFLTFFFFFFFFL
jgi:hypothetical protein